MPQEIGHVLRIIRCQEMLHVPRSLRKGETILAARGWSGRPACKTEREKRRLSAATHVIPQSAEMLVGVSSARWRGGDLPGAPPAGQLEARSPRPLQWNHYQA